MRRMNGPRINPFQPDQPVRPTLFTGRKAELALIRDSFVDALRGHASHVLIVGERGMGKTSLAHYMRELATDPEISEAAGGVPAPVVLLTSLGYSGTVSEACASILTEAHRWARERNPSVLGWFRDELAKLEGLSVGFFGVTVTAKPGRQSSLPGAFPDALETMWKRMKETAGALTLILDETEAISADASFPGFMKSALETLTARGIGNVQFVVTATPDGRNRMAAAHPSLLRSFRPLSVDFLSPAEVSDLVQRALAEGLPRKTADDAFLNAVAHQSSGIPGFVHELGRAAFDVDTDNILGGEDFIHGLFGTDTVVGALAVLEQKLFRERYSQKVLSHTYRDILHAIAAVDTDEVSTDEIRKHCRQVDQVAFYLANMAKRGVVVRVEGKKGVYRLPDRMFKVFLRLAAARKPKR
jgi:hypothetical protein